MGAELVPREDTLQSWRCVACGKVLGEFSGDGFTFRVKCQHRRRDGQGRCNTWNTLTVPRLVPVASAGVSG